MGIRSLFLGAALSVMPAADINADHLVQVRDNGTPANGQSNAITLEGMPYAEARLYIMAAGWEPIENDDPEMRVFATDSMYKEGFIEVDTCAPVGDVSCNFDFKRGGNFLRVHTQGEDPQVTGYDVLNNSPRVELSATPPPYKP